MTNNYLTVIEEIRKKNRKHYICKCKCGNETIVRNDQFKNGQIKSCGCLKREKTGRRNDVLYSRWRLMVGRCHDPKHIRFGNYGAKGISVHEEWRKEFWAFSKYCREELGFSDDMKHLQIDRVDNNGNYEPGNIRFTTPKQNMNNRKNTPLIEGKSLSQIAEETGLNRDLLYQRYKRGITNYNELTKPSRKKVLPKQ